MTIKHLEQRGFKVNPLKVSTEEDEIQHRVAGAIIGRRSRKEWRCAAEDCSFPGIAWDEIYVEATDPSEFQGRHKVKDPKRFHWLCAIRHELIVKDESKTEVINRRGAVAMTKARNG